MVNKILKAIGILGGLFVFSEICGIVGEIQMLEAIHTAYPDETDEFMEVCSNIDEYLKNDGEVTKYEKFKTKLIGTVAKAVIHE